MYEQVITWAGLALLAILCLPFAGLQKLILEVSAWVLRLALLALLGAAAYLWFRPQDLPAEVTAALSNFPQIRNWLPDPASPYFGACLAAPVVAALLPVLAVLDVCRRLAGRRLRRLRALTAAPVPVAPLAAPAVAAAPNPARRWVDRWSAADAMTGTGPRRAGVESDRVAR
jgi:hypothetical protein